MNHHEVESVVEDFIANNLDLVVQAVDKEWPKSGTEEHLCLILKRYEASNNYNGKVLASIPLKFLKEQFDLKFLKEQFDSF